MKAVTGEVVRPATDIDLRQQGVRPAIGDDGFAELIGGKFGSRPANKQPGAPRPAQVAAVDDFRV